MRIRALFIAALATLATVGCAVDPDAPADDSETGDDAEVIARDPNAMPKPILTFLNNEGWGRHHLEWHTIRQWDRLGPDDQAWARGEHWGRADLQEGQKGNGLEFLAMHRVMIRLMVSKFPGNAELFKGFDKPPTECSDRADPCGPESQGPFDANKAKAIDKLQNHLADFKTDDELGLYIETTLRPTSRDPNARGTDKTAGIHNYLHVRMMDPNSKIDVGDPSVNLQNRHFWRIHGWLENRWTEFRKIKKLSESDPAYQAALKKGEDMFKMKPKGVPGGPVGADRGPSTVPPTLRKFFERDET